MTGFIYSFITSPFVRSHRRLQCLPASFQFVLILNEKKAKIRELEQELKNPPTQPASQATPSVSTKFDESPEVHTNSR